MNDFRKYRSLPQNYVAEEVLLGILLIYPSIIKEIKNLVWKEIFFIESNQIIYSKLVNNNRTNFVSIFYELESEAILEPSGGIRKITNIMKKSQIFICSRKLDNYLEQIIKIVKNHYFKRLIIQLGYNIVRVGNTINIDEKYLYVKILSYFNKMEDSKRKNKTEHITSIRDLISDELLNIKYQKTYYKRELKNNIVQSGFSQIDNIIKGLPQGNLIIIAGRPSIGKTSLAINIAYHCFFYDKINLIIFSLEMSSDEIFQKFMSISSKVKTNIDLTQNVINEKWNRISKIYNEFINNNIYINEENNIDIDEIHALAYHLKKKISI